MLKNVNYTLIKVFKPYFRTKKHGCLFTSSSFDLNTVLLVQLDFFVWGYFSVFILGSYAFPLGRLSPTWVAPMDSVQSHGLRRSREPTGCVENVDSLVCSGFCTLCKFLCDFTGNLVILSGTLRIC